MYICCLLFLFFFFFFQAEDGIRDIGVTGVQTCALPIFRSTSSSSRNRLALICATQCTCALAAMISRSNDFVRFTLMAKLSSMKKTAIWPPSARARDFSSNSSFTTLSLVRKRIESPKNPVTVQNSQPYGQPRPDSSGIILNVPQPPPKRLNNGCNMPGSKVNCSSLILSHGISGYG